MFCAKVSWKLCYISLNNVRTESSVCIQVLPLLFTKMYPVSKKDRRDV